MGGDSRPCPAESPPMNENQHHTPERLAADTALISVLTLLSRVLGYARDLCIAALLGVGPWADAFFVAFRTPDLLRKLFGEGIMNLALVPRLARLRQERGEQRAFALICGALAWAGLLGLGISLLPLLAPGAVLLLLAPGFEQSPGQWEITSRMVRVCMPYALFVLLTAVCIGVLNSLRRFLIPALTPVVLNCTLIAAMVAAWYLAGGEAGTVAMALAWSVPLAGALQLLLQVPFLRRAGFRWRGEWQWRDPEVKRLGLAMAPTVFGASLFQITALLATLAATWLPGGSVSWLYFADRLVQFPLGIFAVAVSTAALPTLSSHGTAAGSVEFSRTLAQALGLTLLVSLPAAAGLAGLATPLVGLLFGHGAFSPADVDATAAALSAFCLGLPAFAALKPLVAACHARGEMRATVWSAAAGLLLFLGCAWPMLQVWGHWGLALNVSLACWVNALLLLAFLRRHLPAPAALPRPRMAGLAALTLSAGIYLICRLALDAFPGQGSLLVLLLTPGLALGYLTGCRLLGILPPLSSLLPAIKGPRR